MSHLTPDRLAALVDDTPSPIEAAHITTCDVCSDELAAHRRLARLSAAAQATPLPPLSDFDALLPRLAAEGLIEARDRSTQLRTWTMRIAASLVLVSGGVLAGRATATTELPYLPTAGAATTGLASAAATTAPATEFKSSDEAMKVLAVSQQSYQSAAAFLAAQDTTAHFIGLNQNAYRTRLNALDQMVAATRTALYQAPQDPVLNQAYLGLQGAREATLRQINAVAPASNRLERY
jgi:hypothetical protein